MTTDYVDEPHDPRELYPLIAHTAADAGWDDPLMDDYDRYDELMESRSAGTPSQLPLFIRADS